MRDCAVPESRLQELAQAQLLAKDVFVLRQNFNELRDHDVVRTVKDPASASIPGRTKARRSTKTAC